LSSPRVEKPRGRGRDEGKKERGPTKRGIASRMDDFAVSRKI